MKMAIEDTGNAERSYKELKKMAKNQKKAKKKAKKKEKLEKKIAKKEAKMRKKGMFLEEVTPVEESPLEETREEFEAGPWVRKSTEEIPYLEKKIDRMAERHETSTLHQMFEERYGESLMIPETYKEYELTDAEKRRLEELRSTEEEVKPPVEAVKVEKAVEVPKEGKVEGAEAEASEEGVKPFYYPFQLWLYKKYGVEKHIVLKILILIVSIVGFVLLLIPRIIIFVIILIVKKIKQRRANKAKVPTEA
jgi:hypothetical protein